MDLEIAKFLRRIERAVWGVHNGIDFSTSLSSPAAYDPNDHSIYFSDGWIDLCKRSSFRIFHQIIDGCLNHEVLHKVVHENIGLQETQDLDNLDLMKVKIRERSEKVYLEGAGHGNGSG